MLGKVLKNRYEIFYHLGGGGFGQTYLASDLEFPEHSWLVIKQLKPSLDPFHQTDLKKAQQLFNREIEILQELGKHDRIPSLIDYFTEAGESYLVQEYIDGCVFSEELKQKPEFSEIQILFFLRSSLEVLDFIHSKQIIHRDIKPSNLIRRRHDQRIAFIDFGAVKQIIVEEVKGGTGTRIVTDVYTPREQERGKPKLCSDIYSLGMVAVQAFIGEIPSINDDTNEVDWQSQRRATENIALFLNTMIHEKPIDRYSSAGRALEEVNAIINWFESDIVEQAIRQPTPYKFDYTNYWYTEANKLRDLYGYHHLAIYLYDKAIETNPDCWKVWFNRGITLRYLKRYKEAVRAFDKAISINSKSAKSHFQRGFALSFIGNEKYIDALNSYNLAVENNPLYPIAWFQKGVLLMKLERGEEAIEAYEMAKRLRPSFASQEFLAFNTL